MKNGTLKTHISTARLRNWHYDIFYRTNTIELICYPPGGIIIFICDKDEKIIDYKIY